MLTEFLVAVVAFLVSYIVINGRSRPRGLPPGPFRFPMIGNLPQIIRCGSIDKFLSKYQKIYGEVSDLFSLGNCH